MLLGMAVLGWFSVLCVAGGRFDKLSDRSDVVTEPAEVTVVRHSSPTVVRQGSPTVVRQTLPSVVRQESSGKGKLIDDVNVFVGTDGFGNVYPGPQVPFGGIQISPDCDDKEYD